MPVYEETYRSWGGTLVPHPRTWWIIARTGVRLKWKRGMIVLLIIATLPFIVRAVQIYTATRLQDWQEMAEVVRQLRVDAGFFADFLAGQSLFLVLAVLVTGSGLIADDRHYRALPLYFSKPVRLGDYLLGKSLVVTAYSALITLVPALLLFLIRLALATDTVFLQDYWWVLFSVTGQSLLMLVPLTALMLALSAGVGNGRSAALLFFGLWVVPDLFRQILSRIESLTYISLPALLRQSSAFLFGRDLPYGISPWGTLIALLLVTALSLLFLARRVRPTEVVA
jgi:ABC-type transport system involved in multi-copper enzyme maturation permease subunit